MVPALLGRGDQPEHKFLYWEFHEKGGRIAVRMGRWKGVRYNVLKNPDAPMKLFDLSVDPGEQNNVAKSHPETVEEIEAIMEKARTPSAVFQFGQTSFEGH